MVDVAVIGAGMAGLVCAQQLQQQGYQVVVIEKSRGLGGRVATRRLQQTCADHGLRYLENQGTLTDLLIKTLLKRRTITPWVDTFHEVGAAGQINPLPKTFSRYVAPAGMTAVAKFLASNLAIWQNQRVQSITPTTSSPTFPTAEQTWQLRLEATNNEVARDPVTAKVVVVAIPAPQALMLLEPLTEQGLSSEFLAALRSVEFDSCLTAIVTYPPNQQANFLNLPWRSVTYPHHADLAWVALDSSKRPNSQVPVLVLQSTAAYAEQHLEATDLQSIGHHLLKCAQPLLGNLMTPESFPENLTGESLQVHRWRYAFVRHPWQGTTLNTVLPLPLVCSGDWCGANQLETALTSGLAAARWTIAHLNSISTGTPTGTAKSLNISPETLAESRFEELIEQL